MRRIMITGASGLIGSHLVPLLTKKWKIHVISHKRPLKPAQNVRYHNVDLSGEVDYSQFPEQIDAIVYLAQSNNYKDFPNKAVDVFQVNTSQVLQMLDYARRAKARSFIYASTGGVYGSSEFEKGLSEENSITTNGNLKFYPSTKLCSEILAQNFKPYMNITLLRFFFVYGRWQKSSMLVPRLIHNVRSSTPILLQGKDGIKINPIHAFDAVNAIKAALNLKGSYKINVAGPDVLSLRKISEIIGFHMGIKPIFKIEKDQSPQNLIGDIRKMKKYLCKPFRRFEKSITELI